MALRITYHEVSVASTLSRYSVSCERFAEHLQVIGGSGNVRDYDVLSFDDGDRSQHEQAFPLLEREERKALFFVVAERVGYHPRSMTWNQLRELSAAGHLIQSHGMTHRFLTACSLIMLRRELEGSRKKLEDKLGAAVDMISAPGGRFNREVAEECGKAGYTTLYVSEPWLDTRVNNVRVLGRLMIDRNLTAKGLSRLIDAGRGRRFLYSSRYQLAGQAKHILGDALYQKLWRRLSGRPIDDGEPTFGAQG